ncbi:SDR family oxidoreductase [Streptomyces sp. NBC_00445]|uniref:SDR family NAD(P)-dependent oxidoreductase n=1 Tax=Streptomyces sp. NBC_00445 TaxID=2975745 RepID=UPI002E1BEE9F
MTEMTEKKLAGRTALVTGGSRGIGAAAARRLAAEGADVAIAYAKSKDKAEAVVGDLNALGVRAAAFQADQGVHDEVVRMVGEVAQEFGRIDIVVNSAGIFLFDGPTGKLSPSDVARQWAVNVQGVATTTQEALQHMPDGGRVINLGSVVQERAFAGGFADYSATKAAVSAYAKSWAHELAPRKITANTIVVSFSDTDMVIPPESEMGKIVIGSLPLRRYSTPDEVAAVIAFVASPDASYMTGGDIRVDGGWNA